MWKWLQRFTKRDGLSGSGIVDTRTSTGLPRVNETTALSIPAFWRGLRLVSEKTAKLPLYVYSKGQIKKRDYEHPASKLLNGRANEFCSAYMLRQTLQKDALLYGNGFAAIIRQGAVPTELIRLNPSETNLVADNGTVIYSSKVNGLDVKLLPENVLHIKGLGDGLQGVPVLQYMRPVFQNALSLQKFSTNYFANNAKPSIAIKLPRGVTAEEDVKRIRNNWHDIHGGIENSQRVALLEQDMSIEQFSFDAEQSQLLQARQFSLIDFCNLVGCPPHKLGSGITTAYASLESENRAFLDDLDGWLPGKYVVSFRVVAAMSRPNGFHQFTTNVALRCEGVSSGTYGYCLDQLFSLYAEMFIFNPTPPGGTQVVNINQFSQDRLGVSHAMCTLQDTFFIGGPASIRMSWFHYLESYEPYTGSGSDIPDFKIQSATASYAGSGEWLQIVKIA